jgi:hypothetical protein
MRRSIDEALQQNNHDFEEQGDKANKKIIEEGKLKLAKNK